MKRAKTKYPTTVGNMLYPIGTIVEVLKPNDPLISAIFPSIRYNTNSKQIAVKFPDRNHASIGLEKQFIILED